MTKTVFLLIAFFNGQDPYTEGNVLWAIEDKTHCEDVAEIFSLNNDTGEIFTCIEAQQSFSAMVE